MNLAKEVSKEKIKEVIVEKILPKSIKIERDKVNKKLNLIVQEQEKEIVKKIRDDEDILKEGGNLIP